MYFTVHLDLIPGNNETLGKAKPTILVKISFVSTFCDSFFIYITSNDNYNMISLATWYNKHLKIYHQIAFENTPTVSLKSKHKVSNIPYPLQRLSTPYPYAT